MTNSLSNFDYRVECDDFLVYELARLIEEDRASFEDEDFRRVIEAGIHEHIERRVDIRAALALRLRTGGGPAGHLLRAVEDIESPLRDHPQIIQSYTAYLFQRLEQCSETPHDERITTAAEVLLDSPEDTGAAEASIDFLGSLRSAISARVLAFAISEPMLEESLEAKAYKYLCSLWPLPRPFILFTLRAHTHEDIPFRWFQLLIDCDEPSSVERILEEVLTHGGDPDYREDLLALVQLLNRARDPETEDKVLQVVNSEDSSRAARDILETFLKDAKTLEHARKNAESPWTNLDRIYVANRRYLAAAQLFDAGKRADSIRALDELLKDDPQYPLALMLKGMM